MGFHWQGSLNCLILLRLLFFPFQKTVETTASSKMHRNFYLHLYVSVAIFFFLFTSIFVLQILQLPEWSCKKRLQAPRKSLKLK